MMKTFISGPMTGIPEKESRLDFLVAKDKLLGHPPYCDQEIVTPWDIVDMHPDWDIEQIKREDIREMLTCTHVFMLKGWENAKGCVIEKELAEKMGLEVIYDE